MRILILEDHAKSVDYIEEFLIGYGHEPVICTTCSKAIEELNNYTFERYIVDLNVATFGLNGTEAKKTQNGLRTGWVFLTNHVFYNDDKGIQKSIIFSDYVANLKRYINSDKSTPEEKQWFQQMENNGAIITKNEGIPSLITLL